jgi:hypothetical protein
MKLQIWKTFLDRQRLLTFDADPTAELRYSLRPCTRPHLLVSYLVDSKTSTHMRTNKQLVFAT